MSSIDKVSSTIAKYIEEWGVTKRNSFAEILRLDDPNTFYTLEEVYSFANEKTRTVLSAWMETIPDNPYPVDLAEFNYKYNDQGQLVHIKTGERYHPVTERHREALDKAILRHIQKRMIKDYGMVEVWLPKQDEDDDVSQVLERAKATMADAKEAADPEKSAKTPSQRAFQVNIFMTQDALTNRDKLLLLIQGSGGVRPGQWSRKVCVNDSLDSGAIFKYLDKAKERGYGVIVLNPNGGMVDNDLDKRLLEEERKRQAYYEGQQRKKESERVNGGNESGELGHDTESKVKTEPRRGYTIGGMSEGKRYFLAPGPTSADVDRKKKNVRQVAIPGHGDCMQHTRTVWKEVGSKSVANDIVIIAHSAGGYSTLALLNTYYDSDLKGRLKSIAFTDAVHDVTRSSVDKEVLTFLNTNAVNWVIASTPLDTPEMPNKYTRDSGCSRVSAGHGVHEFTSATAIESVWKLIDSRSSDNPGNVVYNSPRP